MSIARTAAVGLLLAVALSPQTPEVASPALHVVPQLVAEPVRATAWPFAEEVVGWRAESLFRVEGVGIGTAVRERGSCLRATQSLLGRMGSQLGWPAQGLTFVVDAWRDNELGGLVVLQQTLPVRGEPRIVLDSWVRVVYGSDGMLRAVSHRVWLGAAPSDGDGRVDVATAQRRVVGQVLTGHEPLRIDAAQLGRRLVVVDAAGAARAAFEFVAEGAGAQAPFLRDRVAVYVAEQGGEVVLARACSARAHATGTGRFWNDSPSGTPVAVLGTLHHLRGNGFLQGDYVHVQNATFVVPAYSPNNVFDFIGAASPNVFRTGEVMAYVHMTNTKLMLNSLGFWSVMAFSIPVHAMENTWFSSYNVGSGIAPWITLDASAVPYAQGDDRDVILHEYAHGIHHAANGGGSAYPFDPTFDSQSAGTDEGLADLTPYLAGGDPLYSEHSAQYYGEPFSRILSQSRRLSLNWMPGNPQTNGQILSGMLRDLARRRGNATVERLVLQSMLYTNPNLGFDAYLETALLQADLDLYQGANASLLRQYAWVRDIHGAATTSPFAASAFPESPHPYPDATDTTQTFTLPGATSLRVVFDPSTRLAHTGTVHHDALHVRDGTGTDIPGSPFGSESLQGRAVTVPGNTVQLRLVSAANDQNAAAGYRIASIQPLDPVNQPPVAQLVPSISVGMAPLRVLFDAGTSSDPDGSVVVYELDPGDGSETIFLDPQNPVADVVYLRHQRNYFEQTTVLNPSLTVTDDRGNQHTTTVALTIHPYSQSSSFSYFGAACDGGQTVGGATCLRANDDTTLRTTGATFGGVSLLVTGDGFARQITGFDLYCRTVNGSPLAVPCFVSAHQATGPFTTLASGTMTVGGTPGWYSVSFPTPAALPAAGLVVLSFLSDGLVLPLGAVGGAQVQALVPFQTVVTTDSWKYRVHCVGDATRVQPVLDNQYVPATGTSYKTLLDKAPAYGLALMSMGFSQTTHLGIPLPFSLAVLGAPGCNVLVAPEVMLLALVDGGGRASHTQAIPNVATLRGLHVYQQWVVLETAANALGLSWSRAVDVLIGGL